MLRKVSFLRIFKICVFVLLLFLLRPIGFLLYSYLSDKNFVIKEKSRLVLDASGLNAIKVDTIVKATSNIDSAAKQIIALIKLANREGKAISIAGAKHTMGGHTVYRDGIVLDMTGIRYINFDSKRNLLTVGSGALWAHIIPYLDKYRKSVAVMQSNNSFSVGGSVSANCHGWQPNSPPVASTVESFRLINSIGEVLTCSRNKNSQLFSLVLGGYGLFGVILDLKLRVIDNKTYIAHTHIFESKNYLNEFRKQLKDPNVGLAYGRINVNPDNFMEEAILSVYTSNKETTAQLKLENTFPILRRTIFRASANSEYGKNLRWKLEKLSTKFVNGRKFTRNKLLNEAVEVFQNSDTAYTDILQEYFIPPDSITSFITKAKKIIPGYKVDLLNITVRNVKNDSSSFLSYARGEVFGFVMLFNQRKDNKSEQQMKALTQKLISVTLALNGTYYLPYRLHASRQQMFQAYPKAKEFFRLKKKYDPDTLFKNKFFETYKL